MAKQKIDPISGNVIGVTKQTSWFRTQVDFENSFKWWFALQWQNKFMPIFIVTFTATIIELFNLTWISDTVSENFTDESYMGASFAIAGLVLPPLITLIIAYKGFWQFFNDLKHGKSR
jgi:hypothetical protein